MSNAELPAAPPPLPALDAGATRAPSSKGDRSRGSSQLQAPPLPLPLPAVDAGPGRALSGGGDPGRAVARCDQHPGYMGSGPREDRRRKDATVSTGRPPGGGDVHQEGPAQVGLDVGEGPSGGPAMRTSERAGRPRSPDARNGCVGGAAGELGPHALRKRLRSLQPPSPRKRLAAAGGAGQRVGCGLPPEPKGAGMENPGAQAPLAGGEPGVRLGLGAGQGSPDMAAADMQSHDLASLPSGLSDAGLGLAAEAMQLQVASAAPAPGGALAPAASGRVDAHRAAAAGHSAAPAPPGGARGPAAAAPAQPRMTRIGPDIPYHPLGTGAKLSTTLPTLEQAPPARLASASTASAVARTATTGSAASTTVTTVARTAVTASRASPAARTAGNASTASTTAGTTATVMVVVQPSRKRPASTISGRGRAGQWQKSGLWRS